MEVLGLGCWELLSTYEWVQILVSVSGIVIALVLAWVAYSSFQEIRKDRKLRFIDLKLSRAYNPLALIISRELEYASITKNGKLGIRKEASDDMRKITTDYAYYLDDELIQLFTDIGRIELDEENPNLVFVNKSVIESLCGKIVDKTGILRRELEKLVKD